jgi:uncharacterized RmlC-like cupin family protein
MHPARSPNPKREDVVTTRTAPAEDLGRSGGHGARIIRPLELVSHAIASAGITRIPGITHELVGANELWIGMTVLEPGAETEPHHHGDHETGVYLVAGRLRLQWGPRLESVAELEVGDLVFLPPRTPHAEVNPSPDEAAVWVVLRNEHLVHVPLAPTAAGVYGSEQAH